ncbi:ATP-binding protein, partial [Bacillus spizizenii]|nr:ATP-binding protein [Bacillus spizizenii]
VKQLVEMHQGTVEIKSEKGKGTTFIIRLPLTAKQP